MKNIIERYDLLTEAEKRVCSYVIENVNEVKEMNINELARLTFTSKTVVINMAKKIGFDGYSELKYYLKTVNNSKKEKNTNDIFTAIEMTKKLISQDTVDAVAKTILKATTVYIAARGTSKTCAAYLSRLLLIVGVKCILIDDYNLLTLAALKVERREVFILISLSGETPKIIETAKIVKSKQARVISITSFSQNTLSKLSDAGLYGVSETIDTKDDDDNSRIGFFIIIEILVNTVKRMIPR